MKTVWYKIWVTTLDGRYIFLSDVKHSEEWDLLGCYAVATGKELPTFRRITVPHVEQHLFENLKYRRTHSFVWTDFAILGHFFYGVAKCRWLASSCIYGSSESLICCVARTDCASTSVTGIKFRLRNVSWNFCSMFLCIRGNCWEN
jgi:hypothetical protein